jgi:hypothetical protein
VRERCGSTTVDRHGERRGREQLPESGEGHVVMMHRDRDRKISER